MTETLKQNWLAILAVCISLIAIGVSTYSIERTRRNVIAAAEASRPYSDVGLRYVGGINMDERDERGRLLPEAAKNKTEYWKPVDCREFRNAKKLDGQTHCHEWAPKR